MKKLAALLLSAATLLTLCACNVAPEFEEETTHTGIETASDMMLESSTVPEGTTKPDDGEVVLPAPEIYAEGDYFKAEVIAKHSARYYLYDIEGNETFSSEFEGEFYIGWLSEYVVFIRTGKEVRFYDAKNNCFSPAYPDCLTYNENLILYFDGSHNYKVLVAKSIFDDSFYKEFDLNFAVLPKPYKQWALHNNKLFLSYYEKGSGKTDLKSALITLYEEEPNDFIDYASVVELVYEINLLNHFFGDSVDYNEYFQFSDAQNRELFEKLLLSYKSTNAFYYAIKDLNLDGVFELILLNNDYEIMAIFTTVDGKPQMVDHYWEEKQCVIDHRGWIYIKQRNDSKSRSELSVYQLAKGGSDLERLVDRGRDWSADTNGRACYKIVDGERVSISEQEFDAMGGEFIYPYRTNTEDCANFELFGVNDPDIALQAFAKQALRDVLENKVKIFDAETGDACYLTDCKIPNTDLSLSAVKNLGYAFADADGDGVFEFVIDCGATLVLRYEDGRVTFSWKKLPQKRLDKREFFSLTLPWKVKISSEDAWKIANDYWGDADGRLDGACGTTITSRVVLREDPYDDIRYYHFVCQAEYDHHFDVEGEWGCYDVGDYREVLVNALTGDCKPYEKIYDDGK
ncbi:MAG: hypothetical protein IJX19_09295 [Clostridia bacterium]|nr:hypothetical protein [Clostridia bacterium]